MQQPDYRLSLFLLPTVLLAACAPVASGPYYSSEPGEFFVSSPGQLGAPAAHRSNSNVPVLSGDYLSYNPETGMPFVLSGPRRVPPFPLVLNQAVQRYVDSFVAKPQGLKLSFERSNAYLPAMVKEFEERGLPPDLVYLSFAESLFTREGAGPWQLNKATARRYGLRIDRYVDERRDPVKSTRAAAQYLARLHEETNDWDMTLVGWNTGDAEVVRFWSLKGTDYDHLTGHLPPRTRALLNRFMAVAFIAHNARRYGFQPATYSSDHLPYRTVHERGGVTLAQVARRERATVGELRWLNPELLRDRLPPDPGGYELRVPSYSVAREHRASAL